MFPTPVGMNRVESLEEILGKYVPHTRGDEPALPLFPWHDPECSPHPWG